MKNRETLRDSFGVWLCQLLGGLLLGGLLFSTACHRQPGDSATSGAGGGGGANSFQGNAEAYSGIIKRHYRLDPRALCASNGLQESGFQSVIETTSSDEFFYREACATAKTKLRTDEVKIITIADAAATEVFEYHDQILDPLSTSGTGGKLVLDSQVSFTDTIARFTTSTGTVSVFIRAQGTLLAPINPQAIITSSTGMSSGVSVPLLPGGGSSSVSIPVVAIHTDASERIFNGSGIQLIVKRTASGLSAKLKYNGQDFTTTDCLNTYLTPPAASQSVPQLLLAAGSQFSCAAKSTGLLCWGAGLKGQLGNNDPANYNTPQVVPTFNGATITSLSASEQNACAVSGGIVSCWGDNSHQQTGLPAGQQSAMTPVAMTALASIKDVAVGLHHVCAVSENPTGNIVYCWGRNDKGQLGNTDINDQNGPAIVNSLPGNVIAVSAGAKHTCALTATGDTYCWGENLVGQIGNPMANQGSSVPIKLDKTFTSIKSAGNSNCATDSDNAVWCWGSNAYGTVDGEAGLGVIGNSATPRKIATLSSGVSKLAMSPLHACALLDNAMWCWGRDDHSLLADGTATPSMKPVTRVGAVSSPLAFALGGMFEAVAFHTLVSTVDGLKVWGDGIYGQLGNGNNTQMSSPANVTLP